MEAAEPPEQELQLAPALSDARRERLPKSAPYHDEIAPELADDLHLEIGKGLALAQIGEDETPERVVDAIANYLDSVRPEDGEARLALACAYGHQLCRRHGWAWAHVRRTKRPGIVILSPDTRWVVAPRALVDAAIDTDARGGALLSEHLERLGDPTKLPDSAPGRYTRLQP